MRRSHRRQTRSRSGRPWTRAASSASSTPESWAYRDAWESVNGTAPGHTFTPRNPLVAPGETAWDLDRRIDYVFVRCDDHGPTLDIRACRRLFDVQVDGVWASDHFGVAADLAVPTRERPFHE